jgi:hypothetical protein
MISLPGSTPSVAVFSPFPTHKKSMAFPLSPWQNFQPASLVGQAFRLRHLRRALEHLAGLRDRLWLSRPGAIAEHFVSL